MKLAKLAHNLMLRAPSLAYADDFVAVSARFTVFREAQPKSLPLGDLLLRLPGKYAYNSSEPTQILATSASAVSRMVAPTLDEGAHPLADVILGRLS